MFETFYGLTANPFRMSADEHFRYAHRTYVKAWSYLKYALEQAEGFVLITGRPGTGKTTLVRDILSELDSEQVEPVNLVTNRLQGEELLRLVALEFGYPAQEYNKAMLLTRIEQHALELDALGRRVVVIVDEGQNLSVHGLEELRLLSNLQAGSRSLFQIVLIGQEELRGLIYGQGIENVQQRIVTSCRLEPMSADQIQGYVEHRLGIAGWNGDPDFDPAVFPLLHRITHGVPREINLVAARLLLYGSLEQKHAFSKADLLVVLSELDQEQRLAFDQTAILAELQEDLDETETTGESEPVSVSEQASAMPSRQESVDQADGLFEDTIPDPEEPVALSYEQELRPDELPHMRATADDDAQPNKGLFTDVNELLAPDDRLRKGMHRFWRWIFYPAAIAILLMVFLLPVAEEQRLDPNGNDGQIEISKQVKAETQLPQESEVLIQTSTISDIEREEIPQAKETAPRREEATTATDSSRQQAEKHIPADSQLQLAEQQVSTDSQLPQAEQQVSTDSQLPQAEQQVSTRPSQQQAEKPTAKDSLLQQEVEQAAAQSPPAPHVIAVDRKAPASRELPDRAIKKVTTGYNGYSIETDKAYFLVFTQPNDTLDDSSELSLSRLTAWLHANPSMVIVITGILEAGQEPMARMRQALQRAEQISARLISAGISSRRIFVEGGRQSNTPDGISVSVKVTL